MPKVKDATADELEEKVDKLAESLATIINEIKVLSSVKDMAKKIGSLEAEIKDIKKALAPVSKIDDLLASVNGIDKNVVDIVESREYEVVLKKVDDLLVSSQDLDAGLSEIKDSKALGELGKKVEAVSSSVSDISKNIEQTRAGRNLETLEKKIDDLQQYVAGLSSLEEKIHDLSGTFDETREIVSIIVRQLDDIERKYNKSVEEISKVVENVAQVARPIAESPHSTKTTKKTSKAAKRKETEAKTPPAAEEVVLPSTIDGIMKHLLEKVSPATEAIEMADALEVARDKLTTTISGGTPVLFQFGKRARELKSYPPTATLNENDIARLNSEIRTWSTKLKEVTR
jgi:chromosome segregation ATPase